MTPERLYHFSEDPSIARFEPRTATAGAPYEKLVWAVDAEHADLYLFPRDCPRVTFHALDTTTAPDIERFLGATTARRVSAIEARWLQALRTASVYRYEIAPDDFELMDATAGYWTSRSEVVPLAVGPVGDLLDALIAAGVELRVLPSLWPLYEADIASTLGFSIIRWRNAAPREATV